MIKRLCVIACLFFSILSFSQESTSSPYSYYGLGENRFKGTTDTRAMGGVSIFSDSIHLNLQNPAFYSHLRLTTFSVAGTVMNTTFKNNFQKETARRTALDYLAVGLPMGKWGAGFGLMPFTAVGYKITNTDENAVETERRMNSDDAINYTPKEYDHQDPDSMEKPLLVGLYIQDSPSLSKMFVFKDTKTIYGIPASSKHQETALQFIDYIFKE